jgi:hypothetical protein
MPWQKKKTDTAMRICNFEYVLFADESVMAVCSKWQNYPKMHWYS